MAPDYRPKIKKQSQAEALAEFDSAMDWREKLPGVSSIGRFQTYRMPGMDMSGPREVSCEFALTGCFIQPQLDRINLSSSRE
jgi:hypothetical protein